MRTSATSSRHKILSLLAVVALVLGLAPALGGQAAVADEADGGALAEGGEPLSGLLASGPERGAQPQGEDAEAGSAEGADGASSEGAARGSSDGSSQEAPLVVASQLSREVALRPLSDGGSGVPLLADALAGKPTQFVNQEVSLDGSAFVLGSFTVDGMTYAVTGEGTVELVAVTPAFLAGSLAAAPDGGSDGAPSGEDSGSGVPTSPSPYPEGASSDDSEGEDASEVEEAPEPVFLEVPGSVEHDGLVYSVTSIGPRAFVGCDADVVRVPASVASVDEVAFRGSSVGGIEVAEGNPNLASYEGVLYDADFTSLLLIPEGKKGVVRIHSNTSAITPDALSHCASVTSVEVDAGNEAFYVEDGVLYDMMGEPVLGEGPCDPLGADAHSMDSQAPLASLEASSTSNADDYMFYVIRTVQCPDLFDGESVSIGDGTSTWTLSKTKPEAIFKADIFHHETASGSVYHSSHMPKTAERDHCTFKGFRCLLTGETHGLNAWCRVQARFSAAKPGHHVIGAPYINAEHLILWEGDSFWLRFDSNGGSGAFTGTTTMYYGSDMPSMASHVPTRENYTFTGFYDQVSGGTKYYNADGTSARKCNKTEGTTLYAQWEPVKHTITYDFSPGTGSPGSEEVGHGGRASAVTPNKLAGWEFAGMTWDFERGIRATHYTNGQTGSRYAVEDDWLLKANWVRSVTLAANGGTAGSLKSLNACINRPLGQKCYAVLDRPANNHIAGLLSTGITDNADWAPTREGYAFAGYWSTSAETGGTCWISKDGKGSTVTKDLPSTLYARWDPIVTFDRQGGTGGDESKAVAYGSNVGTVAKPTLSGWTFSGYTDDFGTSTFLYVKSSGAATTRTVTATKTLKANWTKAVSLNANGGTAGSLKSLNAGIGRPLGQVCGTTSASYPDDELIRKLFRTSITGNANWAPTRTGYSFAGYYDTSDSTGGTCWISKDGEGETVTAELPSTLYARWTANTYDVSFDANGGKGGQTADVTATYGSAMPEIVTTVPTRTGYEFMGWYDKKDYTATDVRRYYAANGVGVTTWDKTEATTLYAGWKAKEYTMTFKHSDLVPDETGKFTYGGCYPDHMPSTVPDGWEFLGYTNSLSDKSYLRNFNDGTSNKSWLAPNHGTAVYANWGRQVQLDANGGQLGTLQEVPGCVGRQIGRKYELTKGSTVWPGEEAFEDFFKTTFSGTEGWAPARPGYAFTGYWDAADHATRRLFVNPDGTPAGPVLKATGPFTLYAGWKAISYAISYDAAGGELAANVRSSYTIEDAFDLPMPTRYGYQFDGWDVSGVAEDGSAGPVLGSGVEDATADDGSKVTRVKAGTYGDLSCTAKWTLRYDLDVPVTDPGSVTFEADSLTGQVRVKPGTTAEGAILSYMAVPVALDSLACEGLDGLGAVDASGGAPELEAVFGVGSVSKVRFTATLGEGDASQTARLTAGGASGSTSLAGLSIPAATSHDAPGRIPVSYGLELDPDLAIPPVRDAAPVARLTYTVSLPGAGA